jgi:T-complex protein 1 subunit delta
MDKLLETGRGEVLITNDGATILKNLSVMHPTANLLIQTSKAQDVEAGDGTTSVVILAGSFLDKAEKLIERGVHPSIISEGYAMSLKKATEIVNQIATKVDIEDDATLIECVKTSLSSKIVSQNSNELAPLAIKAIKQIVNIKTATNVDLNDIKIVKKTGGTMDDIQLIDGLAFPDNRPSQSAGGPTKIVNPKIAVLQFCLSSPKTDIENNITINDYSQIDRVLKEERKYVLELVRKICASGANVLLIQKSILRDSINDLALHFLAKKKIMVVRDIERTDVEFICKTLGCVPVAHIDSLKPEKLGTAEVAEDVDLSDGSKVFRIGVNNSPTATILVRGTSSLICDEAERSIHDALCVVRCLIKNKGIIAGGGAIEIELCRRLEAFAQTVDKGALSQVIKAYSEALEVIPTTLAENCGISPIKVITELRNKHQNGFVNAGLRAKNGRVECDTLAKKIMQPALVTISALTLATEVTRMILKIDDILDSR